MDDSDFYENPAPAPPPPRHGGLISKTKQNTNCASQTNKKWSALLVYWRNTCYWKEFHCRKTIRISTTTPKFHMTT